ncbi:hypothetical protein L1987_03247 [Smallanthus sonchifolius]|uniref:Uncharacterized protein n=1 Tax=Smallanthus sonchifolius TaxID=185202 RepID=A0ACB9KA12_9ASTR|nr:hypothetical protein L1987_03247 [Smallanthus sonchifolius]
MQETNVIGFVADVGEIKNIKTSKGKDTYKINVLIQDLNLLQNSGLSTCSTDSSKVFGTFLSIFDEYVVNTEFNNTAEVNLSKVKEVVIIATVELIPQDIPWYYLSCKTCNRKLTKMNDGPEISGNELIDQDVIYKCKTEGCNPTAIPGSQRLKIPLTVQDSTGTLSLTLFDRAATKLLKKNASVLTEKHLSGGDKGLYPDEFSELLGKKFAFKIDITQFNIDNKHWVFGISNLTDNVDIIFELEKKANNYEPGNSESISNTLTEIPSQETLNFKASLESTDDNVTQFSQTEGNGKRHAGKEATFKRKSKNPDFKRKLVDAYDIEEARALSTTKAVSDGKKTTLVPKVEK